MAGRKHTVVGPSKGKCIAMERVPLGGGGRREGGGLRAGFQEEGEP